MSTVVQIFVYPGGPGADAVHEGSAAAAVQGTLFDVEGVGPALMLAGNTSIPGEVRRIRASALEELDARARVREGIYRRVGVQVGETPCWAWVAGPKLAPRLATGRRSRGGEGR